jgi:hypothetical protein
MSSDDGHHAAALSKLLGALSTGDPEQRRRLTLAYARHTIGELADGHDEDPATKDMLAQNALLAMCLVGAPSTDLRIAQALATVRGELAALQETIHELAARVTDHRAIAPCEKPER